MVHNYVVRGTLQEKVYHWPRETKCPCVDFFAVKQAQHKVDFLSAQLNRAHSLLKCRLCICILQFEMIVSRKKVIAMDKLFDNNYR